MSVSSSVGSTLLSSLSRPPITPQLLKSAIPAAHAIIKGIGIKFLPCHSRPRLREGKLRRGSIFSVCHPALDAGSILRFFLPPAVSRVLSGYSYYRPTSLKRCGKSNKFQRHFNPHPPPPSSPLSPRAARLFS